MTVIIAKLVFIRDTNLCFSQVIYYHIFYYLLPSLFQSALSSNQSEQRLF